ncbi:MAG: OmpA domain protein [Myxococcaceae bacterium]|nr:OmpA domain protein [Myxococcaceae bacterium]
MRTPPPDHARRVRRAYLRSRSQERASTASWARPQPRFDAPLQRLATGGLTAALLALGALLSLPARADSPPVDSFLPAPDQSGFAGFASTRTPGPWGTDGTLWLDYGLHTYQQSGPDPVRQRLDGTVSAQIGILSRGALAIRMPFVLVQRGDRVEGQALAPAAAGSPAIDGRIRVLGAPVRPDGSVKDGAALALRGVVQLPVGTANSYFGDRHVRTELAATADIELFGIGAAIALGWRNRWDEQAPKDSAFSNVIRLSGGLRLPLPLIARAFPGRVQEAALLEVDVGTPARDFFAKSKTPVEGRLGYRIVVGDIFGTLMFGTAFTEAVGAADFRALMGLGYSPRQHDQDADGVVDSDDQCVHLPEDHDGFEDADGCADDDNDGDLIVDEDDQCPLVAAEAGLDDDEDGCTDPAQPASEVAPAPPLEPANTATPPAPAASEGAPK